ncbi:hypothetical protein D3C86_2112190 [compost metagenome]
MTPERAASSRWENPAASLISRNLAPTSKLMATLSRDSSRALYTLRVMQEPLARSPLRRSIF